MPILIGTRRALLGAKGIKWLLNDSFNDTLTAGNVHGTAATPGPGTRTVVDTDTDGVSVGSGVITHANPNGGHGDPGYWLSAVTRAAGRLMVSEISIAHTNKQTVFGFDVNQSGSASEQAILFDTDGNIIIRETSSGDVVAYTAASHYLAIVLRTTGAYYFIKGGAFTNWTLWWIDATASAATLYPVFYNITTGQTKTLDFLRVPQQTWLPTPLAYDTFTASNGTSLDAHASDTSGPDSQAVASRAWVETAGDWDIQSNTAQPDATNPALACVELNQADVVIDCDIDPDADGKGGILLRYKDTDDYWYARWKHGANDQIQLVELDGGAATARATTGKVPTADGEAYEIRAISYGSTIDVFINGGDKTSYASATLHQTETKHGIMDTGAANDAFDNFTVFPRTEGASGGYSTLSKFTR